jgi:hypothetical protein
MKCPKCGYHSFDHLDNCKKCNNDLVEHKAKFNLSGFFSPGKATMTAPEPVIDEVDKDIEEVSKDSVNFGFDFLEEEDQGGRATEGIPLGEEDQDINIDQPFGADSETLPAESLDFNEDDDDKPVKGSEFAF